MRTEAERARAHKRDIDTRYERNEPSCPAADRPGGARVVLVAPEPTAIRFRKIAQDRVHDRETLLGSCRRVFDLQARAWAYTFRHREDIVQDACVIALAKIIRAEADCPGAEALVPEGLVYWIVRGVMRHRSEGDGRDVSSEAGQGGEALMERREEQVSGGGGGAARARGPRGTSGTGPPSQGRAARRGWRSGRSMSPPGEWPRCAGATRWRNGSETGSRSGVAPPTITSCPGASSPTPTPTGWPR